MTQVTQPTILFVPGLRDHVEDHWQTHAQKKIPGSLCVSPLEHDKLSREARVEALQAALTAIDGPVFLAAHSAGVMIVAHWAQKYHRADIVGALLAAPADVESPMPAGYPTVDQLAANGWTPIPRSPLPFPTIVAASTNDPLCAFERAQGMARNWGSRFVDVGAVGHINPPAGFGEWKQGEALIRELY
jgi:predicted alpha/beta hydrolase family esterase